MSNHAEEQGNGLSNIWNVFLGMMIGGLAGAATMLLFAPQSGKQTREQIMIKGIQIRDQVTDKVKDTLAQVRSDTQTVKHDIREKAGELKHLGQDQIVKQLDRASAVVKAA